MVVPVVVVVVVAHVSGFPIPAGALTDYCLA